MNQHMEFGRLIPVDLRDAWTREDTHFTPWLARAENLALLGQAVGLELELEGQEQNVGPFRADILCKDTADGSLVLIENQIERTDHTHLGQVITYAAGLDAVSVIWIAKRFTDEHRAALDWLNEVSHDKIRFFGLEVELWRIGDSAPAPKFNIIARPNAWSRTIRESTGGASTEHQSFRLEFWSSFLAYLDREECSLTSARTPSKDHWMTWGIGRTGFQLNASIGFRDKWIAAQLVIEGNQGRGPYEALLAQRDVIESEISTAIVWDSVEGRKASYIQARRDDVDPMDRTQWPAIHLWLRDHLQVMDAAFRGRVASLDVSGSEAA